MPERVHFSYPLKSEKSKMVASFLTYYGRFWRGAFLSEAPVCLWHKRRPCVKFVPEGRSAILAVRRLWKGKKRMNRYLWQRSRRYRATDFNQAESISSQRGSHKNKRRGIFWLLDDKFATLSFVCFLDTKWFLSKLNLSHSSKDDRCPWIVYAIVTT